MPAFGGLGQQESCGRRAKAVLDSLGRQNVHETALRPLKSGGRMAVLSLAVCLTSGKTCEAERSAVVVRATVSKYLLGTLAA